MKRNEKILQEAFFKKSSYADKLKRKFPQYEPQDKLSVDQPGFGAIIDPDTRGVTDTKEVKKRLTGAFGAIIGSNSVKNIASRSVKSFPIVISDNVEPETSVMLKRLFEEQYAEYINLLISNQVIDISAYTSGEEGNIAIQALDTLSGVEFGNKRLARKASKGKLDANDFFKNISAYNLIRQENKEYKTGVPILDELLEGAVILPEKEAMLLTEYVTTYPEEFVILDEDTPNQTEKSTQYEYVTLNDYLKNIDKIDSSKAEAREKVFNIARGGTAEGFNHDVKEYKDKINQKETEIIKKEAEVKNATGDEQNTKKAELKALKNELEYMRQNKPKLNRLTSTDILINTDDMTHALDATVGEMLLNPNNSILKNRFEKATILLQSNRIAGSEYIEYLVMRLGMPLSTKVRGELVTKFPSEIIRDPEMPSVVLNRADAERITNNQRIIGRSIPGILKTTFDSVLQAAAGIGSVAGGAAGGYFLGGGSLGLGALATNPITLAVLGGVAGFLVFKSAIGGKGLFGKIRKTLENIFPKLAENRIARHLKQNRKNSILG
jgi:hypothetical protein